MRSAGFFLRLGKRAVKQGSQEGSEPRQAGLAPVKTAHSWGSEKEWDCLEVSQSGLGSMGPNYSLGSNFPCLLGVQLSPYWSRLCPSYQPWYVLPNDHILNYPLSEGKMSINGSGTWRSNQKGSDQSMSLAAGLICFQFFFSSERLCLVLWEPLGPQHTKLVCPH